MTTVLFSKPWQDVLRDRIRLAVQEIEKIDRQRLMDPALAGVVDRIADARDPAAGFFATHDAAGLRRPPRRGGSD